MQAKKTWGKTERHHWFKKQTIKRSYFEDVETRILLLKDLFDVKQYGTLYYPQINYPLYVIKNKSWNINNPTILITGGVHGYETSGIHGALSFITNYGIQYSKNYNFVVAPCISPWGYETINRWNKDAIDPNRSFYKNSPVEESRLLIEMVQSLNTNIFAHFDLHETTNTDNTVFRPALEARDGIKQPLWNIPDGFYLVGDSENPCDSFQSAIIQSVALVTAIAPQDKNNCLIGTPITQQGVINYPVQKIGLCTGFSSATYSTTTEVYPDSPNTSEKECELAQVTAILGGLNYITNQIKTNN